MGCAGRQQAPWLSKGKGKTRQIGVDLMQVSRYTTTSTQTRGPKQCMLYTYNNVPLLCTTQCLSSDGNGWYSAQTVPQQQLDCCTPLPQQPALQPHLLHTAQAVPVSLWTCHIKQLRSGFVTENHKKGIRCCAAITPTRMKRSTASPTLLSHPHSHLLHV